MVEVEVQEPVTEQVDAGVKGGKKGKGKPPGGKGKQSGKLGWGKMDPRMMRTVKRMEEKTIVEAGPVDVVA